MGSICISTQYQKKKERAPYIIFSSPPIIHLHFPGTTSIVVMLTEGMHSLPLFSFGQAFSSMLHQPLFIFQVNMQDPNATGHNFQSGSTDKVQLALSLSPKRTRQRRDPVVFISHQCVLTCTASHRTLFVWCIKSNCHCSIMTYALFLYNKAHHKYWSFVGPERICLCAEKSADCIVQTIFIDS